MRIAQGSFSEANQRRGSAGQFPDSRRVTCGMGVDHGWPCSWVGLCRGVGSQVTTTGIHLKMAFDVPVSRKSTNPLGSHSPYITCPYISTSLVVIVDTWIRGIHTGQTQFFRGYSVDMGWIPVRSRAVQVHGNHARFDLIDQSHSVRFPLNAEDRALLLPPWAAFRIVVSIDSITECSTKL